MAIHTFLASQLSEDDSVRVPIGEWYDQVINWLDRELTGLFDLIEWPFDQAMALMENSNDQFFSVPRVATVVVLGLIAYVGGGIRRAVYVVGAASLLALMGDITWQQSMIMLYALFVVLIAVALWTGLATAVAMRFALDGEGRDGTRAVRRIETGWSLLHPFALMLPAVFFFGIGQTSSMILATFMVLPLAIRASVTAPASDSDHCRIRTQHSVAMQWSPCGLSASSPGSCSVRGSSIICHEGKTPRTRPKPNRPLCRSPSAPSERGLRR